jgi:hypothetical protein
MTDRVDVDALLAKVDLVSLIDGYVPLKKSGGEYEACCPFHAENTPSFKVSPAKQIFHCFGCGASGNAVGFLMQYKGVEFLDAVRELQGDAVPARSAPMQNAVERENKRTPWSPIIPAPMNAPALPTAHYVRGKPVAQWEYRDAEGRLLGCVYRFTKSDGGKEVLPVVWGKHDETGAEEWRWMAWAEPRPLYGLDRLAAKPEATVLLVEGEKCADAGHAALPELVVVSWPGGGKAVRKIDFGALRGRKVITWADCDEPGVQAMEAARDILRSMDCKLWDVVLPPEGSKPKGWDIADAIMDGMVGKDLSEFVRSNARSAVPRMTSEQAEQVALAGLSHGTAPKQNSAEKRSNAPLLIDANDWLDQSTPMEWVVDGIIQRGCLYAMTAVTNHGKTAIGLLMAMCVAAGRQFAGRNIAPGKVMILCGENPDGFRTRMVATMNSLGLERGDLSGLITVLPQALPLASSVAQILEEARRQEGDYSLVLVDTSISYYSGDNEDDNLQARTHAWNLRALSELPGHPAIVANCHPTKNAEKETLLPRGGGAFLNEIDTNLTVWAENETAQLHWHRKKRGPDFDPIPFEFHGQTIEEHGRKIPTVYAAHISEQREGELRKKRMELENRLLFEMQRSPDAGYRQWAQMCQMSGTSAVHRYMQRLKDDGLVKKFRGQMVLTESGKKEAQRIN